MNEQHLAPAPDQRPYPSMDGATITTDRPDEAARINEKRAQSPLRKPHLWLPLAILRSFVVSCCIVSLVLIICAFGADMEKVQYKKIIGYNVPVICLVLIWNSIFLTSTRVCTRPPRFNWLLILAVEVVFMIMEWVFAGLMGNMVENDTATQWTRAFMSILIVLAVFSIVIIGITLGQIKRLRKASLY